MLADLEPRRLAPGPAPWSVGLERADLHRALAGGAGPGRPVERGVAVSDLDDPEAADVLLALGERPVRGEHAAVPGGHDRGGRWRLEASGEHPGPRGLDRTVEIVHGGVHLLHLAGWRRLGTLHEVHAEEVLRHRSSPSARPRPRRPP